MLLHIVARGRIGQSPEAALVDRYVRRIGWPTRITELPDNGGKPPPPAATPLRCIALDERGDLLASAEFARLIGGWRDDGVRELRFLIGAADGLGADERAGADRLFALGRATWPHLMARALLAEQLWRAYSILTNHPYHREG